MFKFFIVLLGFGVMVVMLRFRRNIKDFTGNLAWAERYLGSGGTNTLIVLLALLAFILSLMYALGTLQGILEATLGRFV